MHISEIDRWCDQYEARLKAGEKLGVQEFLQAHALPQHPQLIAELQQVQDEYDSTHVPASPTLNEPPPGMPSTAAAPMDEPRSKTIGPYKLLQKLGEGGMGVVYMAEQTKPVARRVALKIIKPGMDSKQVLARFEAERQALALMDHPNIARILDAGMTVEDRPYFVMELVKGTPISKYCDEKKLTPRERLQLFVPICHAVQHAHHKGVIHRDLKPSNVLVAELDGRPVPKIIDFGLAKAISQKLTEQTMFTRFGEGVGTIDYMSPEQTSSNQLDVDTRTDVYSLGVLLYELLTGETPLDRKRLHQAAWDEVVRIIRQEDPPRPSARLSSHATLPAIAANRRTEPKRLSVLVRGELDWIVMKALEKDRSRRYETANGLALDVQNFLDDEPVTACPPSALYRLQKLMRRHRTAAGAVAAVTLALLFGLLGTTWQAIRATQAEEKAEVDAARAEAISDFLLEDFLAQASSYAQPEPDVRLRTVLTLAEPRIEARFADQPLVAATLLDTIGMFYIDLGDYGHAQHLLQRALELRREHLGNQRPETLLSMWHMARLLERQGEYHESLDLYEQTVAAMQKELGPRHRDTLSANSELGELHCMLAHFQEAEQVIESTLSVQREVLPDSDRGTLLSELRIAVLSRERGRYAKAEELLNTVVVKMTQSLSATDPDTLRSRFELGSLYCDQGRYTDAMTLFEKLIEDQTTHLGESHPSTVYSQIMFAETIELNGDPVTAITFLKTLQSSLELTLGRKHELTRLAAHSRALALQGMQLYDEAATLLEENYEIEHGMSNVSVRSRLSTMSCLASALADVSDFGAEIESSRDRLTLLQEAKTFAQDALEISIDVLGEEHPDTLTTMHNLASIHMSFFESPEIELEDDERDKHARLADDFFNEALTLSRDALGEEHPETIVTLSYFAACLEERQPAQAEEYYREAREAALIALGEANPLTLDVTRDLALFLERKLPNNAAERDEAERLLNQALDACRTNWRSDHPATLRALNDLAWFYWYVDPDRAESLYNESVEGARRELGVDNRCTHQYMLSFAQFLEAHERHQDAALLYRELLRIAVDEETRTKALEGADRTSAAHQSINPLESCQCVGPQRNRVLTKLVHGARITRRSGNLRAINWPDAAQSMP